MLAQSHLPTPYICAISSASDPIEFRYLERISRDSNSVISSQRASITMATKNDRPLSIVITVPDPDNMSVSDRAEEGGTLQWRTESHQYPEFEIRFKGPNPFNTETNLILKGSDAKPVVEHIKAESKGVYSYQVRHIKKDGSFKDTEVRRFVIHCIGCPP
jgi:hypothetical protein